VAIQRYFLHAPKSRRADASEFEAQQKATGAKSFVDPTTKKTTVVAPTTAPKLRVSDDGLMAVEASDLATRQAKVFFADPKVVAVSNARLLETGSKYRLFTDSAGSLRVPSKDDKTLHALDRVLPRDVDSLDTSSGEYGNQGLKMDVEATCDEVAQAIVHTGNIGDFPLLKKSINTAIGFGELNVARYLLARRDGKTPDEAVTAANNALALGPEHDAELKGRTDIAVAEVDQKAAKDREWLEEHNEPLPSDEESARLRGLAATRAQASTRSQMETELKADIRDTYGRFLAKRPTMANNLAAELGVNKHALPEVGQAFGSIHMNAKTKSMDYKTGKARTLEEGGTWGSHYGGVVAKSGEDMVTLENYARNRETRASVTRPARCTTSRCTAAARGRRGTRCGPPPTVV
jgi:hypothetical protein